MLVRRPALIVPDTLNGSDTFLSSEEASVYRRIWKPYQYTNAHDDGKAAKEKVNDLVVGDKMAIVEGDAVCDKTAENLGQACT